jgi:glycosyltransferase involved in cell wall biosynthesis
LAIRMKILIVTNALSGGGAESSMRIISQHLRSMGVDTTLLALNKTDDEVAMTGEVELGRKWRSGILQTAANFFVFYRAIKRIKPDSVIVNCELPELYTAFVPIRIANLICVEHTSKPWAGREFMGRIVRAILSIRKSGWVTVNRSQAAIWPFSAEALYIPNPVEVPKLASQRNSSPAFVFVGRLRREKGIETILKAIAEEKMRIDIFGSGELEETLRDEYSDVALFHGFVNEPWQLIDLEQVLIVASEYEGDGKVVVEGILAGLPILLRDNVDLRRFDLPDGAYFKNDDELKWKLKDSLLNRDNYRPQRNSSDKLRIERDPVSVSKKWLELLR